MLIEDATGTGKTEAADLICQRLIALDRADGIYVGLPTMATADAAFARRAENGFVDQVYAAPADLVLAHSRRHRKLAVVETRAELEQGETACLDWFARSSKRALLTPIGIGTVDQALTGALRARYAPVRLAGLWRKVLVIDEVHAYDDYMLDVLVALLRHQASLGQHVILMSATLPSVMRDVLVSAFAQGAGWPQTPTLPSDRYPMFTVVHAHGSERPNLPERSGPWVQIEPLPGEADVETRLLAWALAGRSAIWFRNTVDEAVRSFERLHGQAVAAGLPLPLLYHARYLPADRAAVEDALLRIAGKDAEPAARRGRIVIATQAAEQSLDLDFDELATDLAPADALIQRLGRRRRHARNHAGTRLTVGPDGRPESPALLHLPDPETIDSNWYARFAPGAAYIYPDHARLWLTQHHLRAPTTIPGRQASGPMLDLGRDVRPLIEAVYDQDDAIRAAVPATLHGRLAAASGEDAQARQAARLNRLPFADGLLHDWHRTEAAVLGDDARAPTRLGESFEILLAVSEAIGPRFLIEVGDPLEESLCRCPRQITGLAAGDPQRQLLARRLNERGQRRLARYEIVVLAADPTGEWCGNGHEPERQRSITIRYDAVKGLRLG
ncbi:MAG: CRISPR-associated helicase Cas3' [Geminicoccaceae bacterium]